MSYLAKRFESAVLRLVSEGPVKQRLAAAYAEHLDDLADSELPESVRDSFADLRRALHRVEPLGSEPCVRATVRKMSIEQADGYAASIVRIYAELVRDGGGPAERLTVVNGGAVKLPRFLAEQGR